ncbi:RNA 2',3'-cyclic phosphodiesterase [Chloroflexota bacterium]
MEIIRSFIAIELPDSLKQNLNTLKTHLKKLTPPGTKWVNSKSIHLTLKFLGHINAERTGEITKVITDTTSNILLFNLKIGGVGAFPDWNRVQVIWVGISGDIDKLLMLQQKIEDGLSPLGFTPETRKFTPHLTLARLNREITADKRQNFGQLVSKTELTLSDEIKVSGISLMKSELTRAGAIHHCISFIKLKR